jgi:hypothetical protein
LSMNMFGLLLQRIATNNPQYPILGRLYTINLEEIPRKGPCIDYAALETLLYHRVRFDNTLDLAPDIRHEYEEDGMTILSLGRPLHLTVLKRRRAIRLSLQLFVNRQQ